MSSEFFALRQQARNIQLNLEFSQLQDTNANVLHKHYYDLIATIIRHIEELYKVDEMYARYKAETDLNPTTHDIIQNYLGKALTISKLCLLPIQNLRNHPVNSLELNTLAKNSTELSLLIPGIHGAIISECERMSRYLIKGSEELHYHYETNAVELLKRLPTNNLPNKEFFPVPSMMVSYLNEVIKISQVYRSAHTDIVYAHTLSEIDPHIRTILYGVAAYVTCIEIDPDYQADTASLSRAAITLMNMKELCKRKYSII